MHLVIDGHGGDRQRMRDHDFIYGFLDRYPDVLGMTKITPPQVYTYYGPKPEDWGVSGFVLIAESHISVHTFPDRGYINVDLFSCKSFDADAALEEVRQTFGLEQVRHWVLPRGLEYADPQEALAAINAERAHLTARE